MLSHKGLKSFLFVIIFLFSVLATHPVFGQTTSFVYQGKLSDSGLPANGTYQFEFRLYDLISGGNQISLSVSDITATVTNGIFAVNLNFGAGAFNSNELRFLEIRVKPNGSGQPYTVLSPRQQITSTPFAIRSLNAEQAQTALVADDSTNLGGVPAAQYVVTTDPRMSDDRNPLPGSVNYIQNTSNQQSNSNFNISGEGKAFKVTGVLVNATSEFQQGGSRVMQFTNQKNGFVGLFTGMNTTGADNMFVGYEAGKATTTGSFNSFFGSQAGKSNGTGLNNSFFGAYAGTTNTTGHNNAFFGSNAGLSNNAGSSNAFFGGGSGFQNFSGSDNSFFGNLSGFSNTTGGNNSYFGRSAGESVTFAGNNSFFGAYSGDSTTNGGNSFFGAFAGEKNTTGSSNSFFGLRSGKDNISGGMNVFIGYEAGENNQTGNNNTFVGASTSGGGTNNTAIGYNASVSLNINHATAIGANSFAGESDTVVLGSGSAKVKVPGSLQVAGSASVSSMSTGSLSAGDTTLSDLTVSGSTTVGGFSAINGIFDDNLRAGNFGVKVLGNGGSQHLCYVETGGFKNIAHCSSSLRYKNNVQNFKGGLNIINRLRPVTFNWNTGGIADVGFVAEEVNEIEPLLSTYNEQGQIEGVKYAQITTALVNAVKEQQQQIEKQQEQIKQQQMQIEMLKTFICQSNPNADICVQPAKKQIQEKNNEKE